MWEVLNDLIDEGVEQDVFDIVVEEMSDMFFISYSIGCTGDQAISLMNPAIGDIAFDVCTPEQIDTICMALLDRMESMVDTLPTVPFVMATFHQRLGGNQHIMMHLYRKGYKMMNKMAGMVSMSKFNLILEAIDEEMKSCGLDSCEVLGKEFQ